MSAKEFNCPNCGGIIEINDQNDVNVHCPFCNSLVKIPSEFRKQPLTVSGVNLDELINIFPSYEEEARKKRRALIISLLALFLFLGGLATFLIVINSQSNTEISPTQETIIESTTPTSLPTMTATPAYAYSINSWGKSGIGEGLFNNPHYIALDGVGDIFVADYDNGRVQRFTETGEYQGQWRVGQQDLHIYGMAADYQGDVYVSIESEIQKYDGKTGELVTIIPMIHNGEYGELATTTDGRLLAMWYEERWGLITSLEGHRESLIVFDNKGNVLATYPSFLSDLTENTEFEVNLAVDGNGKTFALTNEGIFVYNNQGKYIDHFGPSGDEPGALSYPGGIAVDGQGRIYILDGYTIHVFSPDYAFIDDIPTDDDLIAIAIDSSNHIWGLAEDKVVEYQLR